MKLDNKIYSFLIIFMFSVMLGKSAYAEEYIYISDNLRVGIRTEPVSGIPPISVVFTGMRLEVEDRQDGYIKVITDKGVTGWIKDIYATSEAPATIQLTKLKEKYALLKIERDKDLNAFSNFENVNKKLTEQITALKIEHREWLGERSDLLASQHRDYSWYWVMVVIVLMVICFIGGIAWYKAHVMKRLGGLRV